MGWYGKFASHYKNGRIDRKAECDAEWENDKKYKLLKSALVGAVWYGAVQKGDEVFAVVCLTSIDDGEIMIKDMDETMGPFQYDCPKSILKLLTPTDNECANKWRAKCEEKRQLRRELDKLPVGTKILVKSDWEWQDGEKEHVLTKHNNGRTGWIRNNHYTSKSDIVSLGYEVVGFDEHIAWAASYIERF